MKNTTKKWQKFKILLPFLVCRIRNKNETQSVVKNPDMKNQEGDAVENHREQTGNPQRVAVPMAVLLACVGIVLFVRKRSFR